MKRKGKNNAEQATFHQIEYSIVYSQLAPLESEEERESERKRARKRVNTTQENVNEKNTMRKKIFDIHALNNIQIYIIYVCARCHLRPHTQRTRKENNKFMTYKNLF